MSLSPAPLLDASGVSLSPHSQIQIPRAIPYIVRRHQKLFPGVYRYRTNRSRLRVGPQRTGIVCVKGVWVAIEPTRFIVLHSERNARVQINCGSREYHRVLHAGSSKLGPDGLLSGPRPTFISAHLKGGCWPVFSSAGEALHFCPTRWPLVARPVGSKTALFMGTHNGQYVCIECHHRFSSDCDVMRHVGLPVCPP